jgi:integrase
MKGHKRFRSGAWRLVVFAGTDPVTGDRRNLYETVHAANNRAGTTQADARLAELIAAVESGQEPERGPGRGGISVAELAARWQEAHRPRRNARTGDWIGWSPKTAKTHADNFRDYILPTLGRREAGRVSGVQLDRLYAELEAERGLSPAVVVRCHSQVRAMFNWAVRKKLVPANPALAADPPRLKPATLRVPTLAEVRAVQQAAPLDFAAYIQLAATIGARRGTLVALRWGSVDLSGRLITFSRSIAESADGLVEKGTKAERPYVVSIGKANVEVLQAHRERSVERAEVVGVELDSDSFVFSDDGGVNYWNLSWPTHAWQRYAGKVGLNGVRLHDLRHTAASQMLMAGIPLSMVAERLGCTEMNVLRNYRHFIPASDRQAADLMERALAGSLATTSSA